MFYSVISFAAVPSPPIEWRVSNSAIFCPPFLDEGCAPALPVRRLRSPSGNIQKYEKTGSLSNSSNGRSQGFLSSPLFSSFSQLVHQAFCLPVVFSSATLLSACRSTTFFFLSSLPDVEAVQSPLSLTIQCLVLERLIPPLRVSTTQ